MPGKKAREREIGTFHNKKDLPAAWSAPAIPVCRQPRIPVFQMYCYQEIQVDYHIRRPDVITTEGDMTTNPELLKRITARPDVFSGKPIIRDMRISVELILSLMTQGVTMEAILEDYPELEPDDIRACTAYAHAVIAKDTLAAVSIADS